MSFLTNKHVVIALIVAPILAVIAYLGVDGLVSETPHAAVSGARYELLEKPNCRYNSGVCGLKNGDFELKLTVDWQNDGGSTLNLQSIFPLEGARVALVNPGQPESDPQVMQQADERGLNWVVQLGELDPDASRLRMAVVSSETFYYGEVATLFSVYKTSFGGDFRQSGD